MNNDGTHIDWNCVAFSETAHLALWEEAIGEEGQEDELRES